MQHHQQRLWVLNGFGARANSAYVCVCACMFGKQAWSQTAAARFREEAMEMVKHSQVARGNSGEQPAALEDCAHMEQGACQ